MCSGEHKQCKNEKLEKGRRGGNSADNNGEKMPVRNSYSCRKGQKNQSLMWLCIAQGKSNTPRFLVGEFSNICQKYGIQSQISQIRSFIQTTQTCATLDTSTHMKASNQRSQFSLHLLPSAIISNCWD